MRSLLKTRLNCKLMVLLVVEACFCSSCENYDLTGDKTIFVGNWQWVHSIGKYPDPGGGGVISHQIFPSDINKSFSMEFRENGKYLLKDGDDVIHREKAKFATWNPVDTAEIFYFSIVINPDTRLEGKIFGDTVITNQYSSPFYFPVFDNDGIYSSYTNIFVRE